MKQILSSITSKGQVTLPAEVRRCLGVKTNDKILFVIEADGTVRVAAAPYPDVASLRGAAGSLAQPRSWKETLAIAREDRRAAREARPRG